MFCQKFDLIVFGAGPASLTFLFTLLSKNNNLKVLLIERQKFPRHKIGEVILPGSGDILKKLDLLNLIEKENFLRKIGIYYYFGEKKKDGFFLPSSKIVWNKDHFIDKTPNNYSWHVERCKYDSILLNELLQRYPNVKLIYGDPILDFSNNKIVTVKINKKQYCGLYYVDGAGVKGVIPFHIKKWKVNSNFGNFAVYGYVFGDVVLPKFKGLDRYTATFIGASNKWWFWYIPLRKDLASVGLVSNILKISLKERDTIKKYLSKDWIKFFYKEFSSVKLLKNLIKDLRFINYNNLPIINYAANWSGKATEWRGENWFTIGDSFYFADPIFSAGVTAAHFMGYLFGLYFPYFLKGNYFILEDYKDYIMYNLSQLNLLIEYWYSGLYNDPLIEDWFLKANNTSYLSNNLSSQQKFTLLVNLFNVVDNSFDDYSFTFEGSDYIIMLETLFNINISQYIKKCFDAFYKSKNFIVNNKVIGEKLSLARRISLPYNNSLKAIYLIENSNQSKFFLNNIQYLILILSLKGTSSIREIKNILKNRGYSNYFIDSSFVKLYLLNLITFR